MSRSGEPAVELDGITKRFGAETAVDDLSLAVHDGELLTLLGPSGCGKTTILRMIAGHEEPSEGIIRIGGANVVGLPPVRRGTAMMFQSYALFPHMSVLENVAYGLRFDGVGRDERHKRAADVLERAGLADRAAHRPDMLSGGQQQRVALARALIKQPSVLLLDEPLSALDARLRRELQLELKRTQRQSGITFVYVTHDQEEALVMSDRIAVMNAGRILQIGSPHEVFERPASLFVANFIGASNELDGAVDGSGDDGLAIILDSGEHLAARSPIGSCSGAVRVIVRPEHVRVIAGTHEGPNRVTCLLEDFVYLGAFRKAVLRRRNGCRVEAMAAAAELPDSLNELQGLEVTAELPPESLQVFPHPDVQG
jgi:ABC-type Fe3+/spermidine/putrescine transport system ATPase subunit